MDWITAIGHTLEGAISAEIEKDHYLLLIPCIIGTVRIYGIFASMPDHSPKLLVVEADDAAITTFLRSIQRDLNWHPSLPNQIAIDLQELRRQISQTYLRGQQRAWYIHHAQHYIDGNFPWEM